MSSTLVKILLDVTEKLSNVFIFSQGYIYGKLVSGKIFGYKYMYMI
jgi:hypothetical protein